MLLQREAGLMSRTFRAFGIAGAEAHVRPPTRAREETLQARDLLEPGQLLADDLLRVLHLHDESPGGI